MTKHNPTPGSDTGISDADLIRARIAEHCEWFDLTPPKLKVRKGSVYLTDELHDWMQESGASFDWMVCGEVKAMAAAYRISVSDQRRMIEATKGYDKTEREMLIVALRAVADNRMSVDDAMGAFREVFEERRAQMADKAEAEAEK
ncbi:MAG: hypothetical protein ACK4RN_08990 [Pseudorhodobacter sp.]